jgi:hypothetical protein
MYVYTHRTTNYGILTFNKHDSCFVGSRFPGSNLHYCTEYPETFPIFLCDLLGVLGAKFRNVPITASLYSYRHTNYYIISGIITSVFKSVVSSSDGYSFMHEMLNIWKA